MNEKVTIETKNILALGIARELCVEGLLNPDAEIAVMARKLNREEFRTFLAIAVDLRIKLLSDEQKQQIVSKLVVPD